MVYFRHWLREVPAEARAQVKKEVTAVVKAEVKAEVQAGVKEEVKLEVKAEVPRAKKRGQAQLGDFFRSTKRRRLLSEVDEDVQFVEDTATAREKVARKEVEYAQFCTQVNQPYVRNGSRDRFGNL